jgi:HAD superfamily hydrolase (TIGR01509 family)
MLEVSKIRAISLDLDDTLWPVWPTIARAEIQMQDYLRPHAPATAALMADPQARAQLRDAMVSAHPASAHDMSALRLGMIELALQRCAESAALAPKAFEVFYAARQQVELYADCAGALARLAQRFPLLALTNGNADVRRVGIGDFFVGSVGAHTVGLPKPHKAIFDAAADALRCRHEEVLHVGDDALLDVLGALDAGMQSVWVNRQGANWQHERTPHLSVHSLDILCNALGV